VSSSDQVSDRRLGVAPRFAILIGLLLAAQVEDLLTGWHMMRRFGVAVEWGLLAGSAYLQYGVIGLIVLKISLVALVLGTATLLVRVGQPRLSRLAVGLLMFATLAGVLGASSNLRWILRA
jgi:hypothetical protein